MFNRRFLAIPMILAGCSLAFSGFAQEPATGEGARATKPRSEGRAPSRQSHVRILRRLDSNGDDLLSLEELTTHGTANYSRKFARADRDGDGFVSAAESRPRGDNSWDIDVAALRECIAENGGLSELEEDRFAAADKDGDGALNQEEFFMQLEQRAYDQFARMDANADGQLSSSELKASMVGRHEQRRIVRACVAEQLDPFL